MAKNILFLYARQPSFTGSVRDYTAAFCRYSTHRFHFYDLTKHPIDFDLSLYDGIIVGFCVWGHFQCLDYQTKNRLSNFKKFKIAIFQDEYDYFLRHRDTVSDVGFNTIITCVSEIDREFVFPRTQFRSVEFITALTGYVSDDLLSSGKRKPISERRWTVGYRGRPVPFIYGKLTREKYLIGSQMKEICASHGISENIDLSEEGRIYGTAWLEFLSNCRAVLGTESGSNVFDFDGSLKREMQSYLEANPAADFETVFERFLSKHEGKVKMNQISPRIFEAIAMGAVLVLFEGEYSGVVKPWEHFIPLKKDFSNVDEVISRLQDVSFLETMATKAYDEVIASGKYHYRSFIEVIDKHIEDRCTNMQPAEPCFELLGWRSSPLAPIRYERADHLPTTAPQLYLDQIPDPILTIRFNRAALHRTIMRHYEKILYSSLGDKIRRVLKRNQACYRMAQNFVRLLTGRWSSG